MFVDLPSDGGGIADWLRERFSRPGPVAVVEEAGAPSLAEALTEAAVLVPLVMHESGPTVLLTMRSARLTDHPGQVSFPGGRREVGDESAVATALRETFEEIGLAHHHVEVLGTLPEYRTGTGFRVTPVVGLVSPPFNLVLDEFEVDEAFEVPLNFLMDASNHQQHRRLVQGVMRECVAMPYGQYFIWGATAGMLVSLQSVLTPK